mgnify:CR=1 FL=1
MTKRARLDEDGSSVEDADQDVRLYDDLEKLVGRKYVKAVDLTRKVRRLAAVPLAPILLLLVAKSSPADCSGASERSHCK